MVCPIHYRTLHRKWIPVSEDGARGVYVLRCPVASCSIMRPDKYGPKNYKRGNQESTRAQMSHARIPRNKKGTT